MAEARVTPVAVIGMACRLPGGIDSPDKLWQSLLRGEDLITEIPADRWDVDELYDPERGVPGRSVSRWGGFIDDVAGFDAAFFGIGEREATAIDPQHRLLLETAWEAVEHAGIAPPSLAGSATGVFMGLSHDDYTVVTSDAGALDQPYSFIGTPASMASGRIAYTLGLRGPALTVDTACSTGLLAVHLACRSLHQGESGLALAGACTLILSPEISSSCSAQGMLSPNGRCRPFDSGADGFVRSEGCAVVLLKRLSDAERDGDRILAVIRGTAVNQDGRSATITTPSAEAQFEVYRTALAASGVDPDTVGMVEAHGTGTPVGDPLEFTGLTKVYGAAGPCALGSVKGNIGHTESAAGAVGLIKTVLAVQHGVVPATLHFTGLPEDLRDIETKLFVPQQTTPWPVDGRTRRAAVSSFGMSGTNVHALVEQAPERAAQPSQRPPGLTGALVFPLSATSADELRTTARRLADWADARSGQLVPADLAYTLARRRSHRPLRAAVVADGVTDLLGALQRLASDDSPRHRAVGHDDRGPVWVFSGQGSQWESMGVELLGAEPVFAATIAEIEPLIRRESGFSVTEAMTAPETVVGIDRVQPVLFAMQVSLAAAMRSYGVQPGAVIGHSLGEVAAAVVAGALSLGDGVTVICRRSRLCARLAGGGAMGSVELPAKQVEDELRAANTTDVVVSVIASPQSTVVGGTPAAVRELIAAWEGREVMAREVAVDVASHSPHVDSILTELAELLADLRPMTPNLPYYSATLEDPRALPVCDGAYWVENLRRPVQFAGAIKAALDDGFRVFGELAPHPLLTRAVEQTAQGSDVAVQALPAMRRQQEMPHGLRDFLGDLYSAGVAVDFSALYPSGTLVDAPLPTWTHQHLLIESAGGAQQHATSTVAVHPLLGAHVRLPEEPERHAWQSDVGTAKLPWLADHVVNKVAAFPGAAYCEMALSAADTVFGEASEVRDIRFSDLLLLSEQSEVTAVAVVEKAGTATFAVETDEDGERIRRASAELHSTESPPPVRRDVAALLAAHPDRIAGHEIRQAFAARGIEFGPAFTGLTAVHANGEGPSVFAEIGLPAGIRAQQSGYGVHPALLDACFQSVAAQLCIGGNREGGLLLPLSVGRLRRFAAGRDARYCHARITTRDGSAIEADIDVLDEHGQVVLAVTGLRMGSRAGKSSERDRVLGERLLTVEWVQRQPPAAEPATGSWLVIATDDDEAAAGLGAALTARSAACRTLTFGDVTPGKLTGGGLSGVVMVAPEADGDPEQSLSRGRELVEHLVRIAGELPNSEGQPPRLYVITRGAQTVTPGERVNLDHAGVRGLLRVIGAEHPPLRPTQIDVDTHTDADALAEEILSGSEEDETAWRYGSRYVARLQQTPLRHEERRTTTVEPRHDGMHLQVRNLGDLETLEFVAAERNSPDPGQIEVAVAASSVNFADVLAAFGRYFDLRGNQRELGVDFAGVVTAVGPGVTGHKIGDRVGGLATGGCWGTFVTLDARLAAPLPQNLTFEEATAVPIAYATAWYSLHDLARIQPGDRVLIHSATGGVGQAAIAIARHAGAEIFATAGSPGRRELLRQMGIERVYDSRSTEFADQIRRDTNGYGVDIVLNSLIGAAQRAGLELLAFGGRFIEIGKKDVYEHTRVDLFLFRHNLAFHYVDLVLMISDAPHRIGDLLHTVYQLVGDGVLPVPEHHEHPLAEAGTAIRAMSAAEHTGKLVLTVPRSGPIPVVVPPAKAPVFRRDGSYVVTGGLGGLGLFLAAVMASAGCGRIVVTSRTQPTPRAQKTIERLRSNGADIVVECGNIAEPPTAKRLVGAATATGLPLRGVLHAAAVVDDATLANITDDLIGRDWAPKVYGAWYLHHATLDQPLDWFCNFSSAAALLGSPGQGAYAAANSWLDAFTSWRRSKRLPATAIAWGAWDRIGRGAGLAQRGDTTMISPEDGAHAFRALLRYDRGYTGYLPLKGAPWLAALAARSPFAEAFRESENRSGADTPTVLAELASLAPEEWPNRLRRLVTDQVSLILRRAVDPDRPFAEHGLDSLGNLELRTHIETQTGVRVTPKTIVTYNTVRTLAGHLTDRLVADITSQP